MNIAKGIAAEKQACQWLRRKHVRILETNYHCRFGEIDIIAKDKDCIVFVEVRYRSHDQFGSAIESVTLRKQQRIIRTAEHYIQKSKLWHLPCRFDIIAFDPRPKFLQKKMRWLKGAFMVDL